MDDPRPGTRDLGAFWRTVTPLGRTVLGIGLVAWALAMLLGWQELRILATAALIALAVGIVSLLAANSKLTVSLALATPRVVAGEPAAITVGVVNEAGRRSLPVRLETRVGRRVTHVHVPMLAAGGDHELTFRAPTHRRAVVPVGPVRSVRGDPVGLVRREVEHTGVLPLHVHPRSVRIGSLTTGLQRDLEGESTNHRSPSDVAFHTLREYVVGDDRRHIHWRTTARQTDGTLMVREFVDTRRAHVALILDVDPSRHGGDDEFELAISVIASIGARALGDDLEVTCLAGSRRLPTHGGTAFLDGLAGLDAERDGPSVSTIATRGRDLLASASIAVTVVGSGADDEAVGVAADRLSLTARSIIVRVDEGAEADVRLAHGAARLTIGELDQLPRLFNAVAR